MNIVDAVLRQAETRPQAFAIHGPAQSFTYEKLAQRTGRLAAGLARCGLTRGEVVAIRCDPLDFICATLAVAWAGGTSVSIVGTTPEQEQQIVASTGAVLIVSHERGRPASPPAGVRACVTIRELLQESGTVPSVARCEGDDIWRIGFSSGTTGRRKEMKFSHRSGIAKTSLLSGVPEILGSSTLIFLGYPLTFAVTYWLRELSRGATVSLARHVDEAVRMVREHAVDLLVSSPGNAMELAQTAAGAPLAIKTLMLGGAPVTARQRDLLRQRLCDNLWINYGATEVGLIALLDPQLMDREPACAGRLMPWVEAQALDAAGAALPPGEEGVLRYRTPMMASGYVEMPSLTDAQRRAFDGGWFHSGDRGRVSRDGLIYLAAREDDIMNINGNKIDPREIEAVIDAFPGVVESAVVGAAGDDGRLVLAAVVAAPADLASERLRQHCAARLEPAKVPAVFVHVEKLPRNEAGKVTRRELAAGLKLTRNAPAENA